MSTTTIRATCEDAEKRIIRKTVSLLIKSGYVISVNDGEELVLKRSRKTTEIMDQIGHTEETYFYLRDRNTMERRGFIHFVHGNGGEVISNHSDSLDELLKPIMDYSDRFEITN